MILERLHPIVQRLIVSSIAIIVLFFAIWFSFHPVLSVLAPLLTALITLLAAKEYYEIAALKGLAPKAKLGLSLGAAYIAAMYLNLRSDHLAYLPLSMLIVGLVATFLAFFRSGEKPLVNISLTLFALIYLVIPLSTLLQINYFFPPDSKQDGRYWIFYLLAVTYITDSSALFFGKTLGKTKLAPYISPKKTWEGAIGGYFTAVGVSLVFYLVANKVNDPIPMQITFAGSLILGTVLSLLAQIGDLAESLLKRDVGVKDSSKIPGLGGVLDVVDSLIFSAPLLFLFLKIQNA